MRKFVYHGKLYDVDDLLCGLALLGYIPETDTDLHILKELNKLSDEETLTLLDLLKQHGESLKEKEDG